MLNPRYQSLDRRAPHVVTVGFEPHVGHVGGSGDGGGWEESGSDSVNAFSGMWLW
jgi:hypothetical protein